MRGSCWWFGIRTDLRIRAQDSRVRGGIRDVAWILSEGILITNCQHTTCSRGVRPTDRQAITDTKELEVYGYAGDGAFGNRLVLGKEVSTHNMVSITVIAYAVILTQRRSGRNVPRI